MIDYLKAVESDLIYIWQMTDEIKTKEICLAAVKKYPDNIVYVPEELQTDELCKIAICKKPRSFKYIKNPSQNIINLYNLLSI
jgi:hypothetical protein